MARLSSNLLTLEINFRSIEFDWVQYDVRFLWDDKNIVNNEVLKGGSDYWNYRVNDAFRVNEAEKDTLIPFLESVLDNDRMDYWEPLEPDMILAIYPRALFPFSDQMDTLTRLQPSGEKKPTDVFTIIAMIDVYNFDLAEYYQGDGLALIMTCDRKQLSDFLDDLKREYAEFKRWYGLP